MNHCDCSVPAQTEEKRISLRSCTLANHVRSRPYHKIHTLLEDLGIKVERPLV